ncbi:hypothetical protein ANOM_011068 [Aspergillus nomiae NRRL 13137]|uniref:Uncharacterized protein n=1 Tax=Aspergillus nomiae NRRL (strain ATCC 15546 / NRRL 13137 / CBS 260.88 / M93) TaxID=1509407 RepID=A0A0L1ILW4_ASPN3|nr:uncharacterized protein ANOM_011068 [Aspergillus nomiae NRRL 13137]KNG80554.1 hypothetical protein ANOM_011068 [Aspergillus nomiae NRRL 13137]
MTAAAAVGDIAGIANLISQIYSAIGDHIIEKETLIMLLKDYEYRLTADQPFLARGLELRHCQPHAMNLYEKLVLLGEWLAGKHIRLKYAQSSLLSTRRWRFPWKFSGKKRVVFQQFLGDIQHASDRLIDCVNSSPHNNVLIALPGAAVDPPPAGLPVLQHRAQALHDQALT